MYRNFFITLLLSFFMTFSLCSEEVEDVNKEDYESIATLEGMPSAIVGDVVNVITGAFFDAQTDLTVAGAHPIKIQRIYSSDARIAPFTYLNGPLSRAQVWHWNHGGLVYIRKEGAKYKAQLYKGSSLTGLSYRSTQDQIHDLRLRNEYFEHGLTNCQNQEISGRTQHKNTRIHYHKNNNCLIRTGGGIETHARKLLAHDSTKYRIDSEKYPNGNYFSYLPDDESQLGLGAVYANNVQGNLLSKVNVKYPEKDKWKKEPIVFEAQDKRKVSYYFDEGTHINRRLRKVVRSDGPEERYEYSHSNQYEERIIRKELPNGRFLNIEYSKKGEEGKNGRVTKLLAPIGHNNEPHVLYSFKYYPDRTSIGCGYTDVWDAHHNQKRYFHDFEKRLMTIATYENDDIYRTERFYWGTPDFSKKNGQHLLANLITSLIREGTEGPIVSCRNFVYDKLGNVIEDTLFGNLTGKNCNNISLDWFGFRTLCTEMEEKGEVAIPKENGCENFKRHFTYSGLPYNLVTSENNGRTIIKYNYEPNSNRLSSKLTCDLHEQVKMRNFFSYDENAQISKEIVDDGSEEEVGNLLGVTERKITYYSYTQKMPVGLAEIVTEKCLNLSTGKEELIKKVIKTYTIEGYLIREDHFDREEKQEYSLFWKHDRFGNIIEESDPLGRTTFSKYDENLNKIYEQKPGLTFATHFIYDYSNRLISSEDIHENGEVLKTINNYNRLSQCVSTIDHFGNETKFIYDQLGRLVQTIYPCLRSIDNQAFTPFEKTKYNFLDQPISHLNVNGFEKKSEFNIRNKPYLVTHPDGASESFEYSLDGFLKKMITEDGILTEYDLDYLGRPTKSSCYSPEGVFLYETNTEYTAFHKVSETDAAGNVTIFEYDSEGRISKEEKGNHKTSYLYDPLGRVWKTIEFTDDQNFYVKINLYDLLDRIIEESFEDSKGNSQTKVEYTYDIAGNKNAVIQSNQNGKAITLTDFDSYSRPIRIVDAEGNTTHICYRYDYRNSLGQNVLYKETTDPLGRQKIEIFNALDGLEEEIEKNQLGEVIQKKVFYRNGDGLLLKLVETVFSGTVAHREIITQYNKYFCKGC